MKDLAGACVAALLAAQALAAEPAHLVKDLRTVVRRQNGVGVGFTTG